MPMHDWTRVEGNIYHDFHDEWLKEVKRALNNGLLPPEYYALTDQVTVRRRNDRNRPDVLALETARSEDEPPPVAAPGTALHARPRTRTVAHGDMAAFRRRKNVLSVRHTSGDRVVAMVEVVSHSNKSGRRAFRDFIQKAAGLLERDIHLLILDPLPPTARDRQGVHAAVWGHLLDVEYTLPADKRLTLAAYEAADPEVIAYVEHLAVGDRLPDMPLFLQPGGCVMVPLEQTYTAAFAAVPLRWRSVIEAA